MLCSKSSILFTQDSQPVFEFFRIHLETNQEDGKILGNLGVQETLQFPLVDFCEVKITFWYEIQAVSNILIDDVDWIDIY